MNSHTVKVEWRRGLSENWDGWHYKVEGEPSGRYQSLWSSGPYPTLREALIDAADYLEESTSYLEKKKMLAGEPEEA